MIRTRSTQFDTGFAKRLCLGTALLALGWAAACAPEASKGADLRAPSPEVQPWNERELALIYSLSPLPELPPSPSNRVADDPVAARLGRELFFDPGLSRNGSVSCATCHRPTLWFTDGQMVSTGLQRLNRNALSLIGAPWFPTHMWDGRKDSLWSQALGPMEDVREMGASPPSVARHVLERYPAEFQALFGPIEPTRAALEALNGDDTRSGLARLDVEQRTAIETTFANAGKAIEAYERKLIPGPAPFDRFVDALKAGDPTGGGHLSTDAQRGLRTFLGKGECIHCHNGPLLSDFAFHNIGLPHNARVKKSLQDPGRFDGVKQLLKDPFRTDSVYSDSPTESPELTYLREEFQDDLGAFRTPSLRGVTYSAPYGHAGQFETLRDVLQFYQSEPRRAEIGHVDPILSQLSPKFDVGDMLAFLESLRVEAPPAEWMGAD